jgi:hypothetical protein
VFANGHHKPCHRNNNTAHVSGAPYKIPRPHTLHGHSAFAAFAQGHSYGQTEAPVQRSMDTHSLSNNDFYAFLGSVQRSPDGLPLTPLTEAFEANGLQDSLFTSQSSTYGQASHSPTESHLSDTMGAPQWPWASSVVSVNRNFGYGSLSTSPSQDCLPNLENEWSIPSAGLTDDRTWSAGDLPLDPSKLTESFVQPISQSGESKQSAPGLTASSSPSEMGEPALFGDLDFRAPPSAASESLFWEDSPVYRLAASRANESRAPTSVPQSSTPEPQGIDFSKHLGLASVTTSGPDSYSETQAIAMPNNIDDIVPNDPWLLEQDNVAFGSVGAFDMSYNWL